jgi:two-component system, LuxR family, response regulator FixJ
MLQSLAIALVEPDARLRAEISYAGAQAGLHLEPFADASELQIISDKHALLVHDMGQTLTEVLERRCRDVWWLPLIAYAAHPPPVRVAEAVIAGAVDYLSWPFSESDLRASLERARDRNEAFERRRSEATRAWTRFEVLSGRERQVILAMAEGLTNRGIAEQFGISPRTVEIHRANAIKKLGVESSCQAIRLAFAAAIHSDTPI